MIAVLRLCSLGQEYLPVRVRVCVCVSVRICVCVSVCKAGAREGRVFSCNILGDYGSIWSMCVG